LAAVAVGLALGLRELLLPFIGHNTLYITLFPAIMGTAVLLGAGPGVASALLGVTAFELTLVYGGRAAPSTASLALRTLILLATSAFVGWISARLRAAKASAAREALAARTAEAAERRQAELMEAAHEALIVDVAARRAAEDALRRAVTDLEHANEALRASKLAALNLLEDAVAARHRAEEGQRVLDALMASVPEGITLTDADGRVRRVSRHGEAVLGHSTVGESAHELVRSWPVFHADGVTPMTDDELPLSRALRRGETVHDVEVVQVGAEGRRLTLSCNAAPIRDEEGRITGGIVAWRDVGQAREAERRHSRILATAQDGYLMVDRAGRIVEVNDALCGLLGYSRAELQSLTVADVEVHDTPEVVQDRAAELRRTGFAHFESQHRCQDGSIRDVAINTTWLGDPEEHIVAFVSDITERKRAEAQVRASLQEHEVLLKEIHHRVKNNLQIIASLVSLQGRDLPAEVQRELFDDVHDRVRSMALVHEKLYQSPSLSCIDFADYASSLLTHLWRAHGASRSGVRLVQRFERVLLSIEEAVPCGLILNELVSNALKHAFRDRGAGELVVTLEAGPDGRVRLGVVDDGWGMPPGVDWEQSRSLGLRLVRMLAAQLRASVTLTNGAGCAFSVAFNGSPPPSGEPQRVEQGAPL